MNRFNKEIEIWKHSKKEDKLSVIFKNLGFCTFQNQKLEKLLLLMIASYFKKEKNKLDNEIMKIISKVEYEKHTLGQMYINEIKPKFDISKKTTFL